MTQHIYIIRHAQATGQEPEARLTTIGEQQAYSLAKFLNQYKIDRIITSPFIRAVHTIEPFAREHGYPIELDRRIGEGLINERQFSRWLTHLTNQFQDVSFTPIETDSPENKRERAIEAIEDIKKESNTSTAIVSHGGIIPLLFHHFGYGAAFSRLTNPDVHLLTISETDTTIERIWQPY
ncbi:histidine phosphatase family protein [Alkalibacillus almallahensis]|uniref:histidine phosphatase family protein n=1 Tax=Alkalibacillus almallahensis TaxID=1379154 RepID=UPI0014214165|nr:histidine phosphatase family protein [Alkalibacillus almallahensis]NIK11627.1 2,3-bisphosphoglycerate-dependent phosphoglycerate mutase [Alkalibacillus almallahensis]